MSSIEEGAVNYDSEAVMETAVEGTDYRLDAGKQGTALCISKRESGSWDWEFVGEAKWDNTTIRCKALARGTCEVLSRELRDTMN